MAPGHVPRGTPPYSVRLDASASVWRLVHGDRLAEIRFAHCTAYYRGLQRFAICCPHQLMGNKGGGHVRTLEASHQSCQRLSYALCHCRFRLPTRTSAWLAPELV